MKLKIYVRDRLKKKAILLMTHVVVGYPSLADSLRIVESMVSADVDLMELQIPSSEPPLDGPVIRRANHKAVESGITVDAFLDFARVVTSSFDIPFIAMTYYKIPFAYGLGRLVSAFAEKGFQAAIVPDLPQEQRPDYVREMEKHDLAPISLLSPSMSLKRMREVSFMGGGFVYCTARKGVTGEKTDFSSSVASYLGRCRKASKLPLAVGFGVREREDINFLRGKAEIAVIGTRCIEIMEASGLDYVGTFLRGLRG